MKNWCFAPELSTLIVRLIIDNFFPFCLRIDFKEIGNAKH